MLSHLQGKAIITLPELCRHLHSFRENPCWVMKVIKSFNFCDVIFCAQFLQKWHVSNIAFVTGHMHRSRAALGEFFQLRKKSRGFITLNSNQLLFSLMRTKHNLRNVREVVLPSLVPPMFVVAVTFIPIPFPMLDLTSAGSAAHMSLSFYVISYARNQTFSISYRMVCF